MLPRDEKHERDQSAKRADESPKPQEKKPFVTPRLMRLEKLPRVTNGFAGSFPP